LLTGLLAASLVFDFVSLLLLGAAITVNVLEQRGKLKRKSTRPYCVCCGKNRRLDIFMLIDIGLAAASIALFLACVGVAFSNPVKSRKNSWTLFFVVENVSRL
jgi:hypothetical protein